MKLLKDRRSELRLRFSKKSLKHPKHKEMFPLNKKVHNAVTRNPEKFKVEFARTERLKNSPLIYMQKMLNNENKIT